MIIKVQIRWSHILNCLYAVTRSESREIAYRVVLHEVTRQCDCYARWTIEFPVNLH